jgi:23S rRNA-/tRNA-specific pseudouridylate synthase
MTRTAERGLGPLEGPFALGTHVLWQRGGLVAIDKPAGVLSQPGSEGPNLVDLARAHFARDGVGVLHRLDRNVSGIVLLALDREVARAMSEAFARGEVDRRYTAVVRGAPRDESFAIDAWLDKDESRNVVRAKDAGTITAADRATFVPARTEVRVTARFSALFGRGASVEARPISGRSHQIRVHLAHVGLPIVGDPKYGVPLRGLSRPLLHAHAIAFVMPGTGERVEIASPVPWSLTEVKTLRRHDTRR